ncbi:GrBNV gp41-like protein-like protein [Mauternbach virus]|uniref:GrBNV gp41-like protein-like protein n=1 Tax=Mauternbach virus TaxID=2486603 RepID=A0A3G3E8C4_9VIRU|nr:GrBNV gp41-like protein-like protein [Mauternbach virus]AYP97974.1 GrBNV gp41-like protein-like protein [Mauternbach virus]
MYIKFADLDGNIFDDEMTNNLNPSTLGEVVLLNDGIIIYDRFPNQKTTQLHIGSMIETLKFLLNKTYSLRTNNIQIYLPRMSMNMNDQAMIQKSLLTMSSIDPLKDECSLSKIYNKDSKFNITLIHV